jgi:hypothetical protein
VTRAITHQICPANTSIEQRTKSEYDTLIRVAELRTCTVSYKDLQDIEHAVQVTAETLYEAAALGLAAFRKADLFGGGAPAGHAQLTIRVSAPVTIHTLSMQKLNEWLACVGRSPKEQAMKARLNELLQKTAG